MARRKLRPVPRSSQAARATEPSRLLGPQPLREQEFRDALGAVDFAVDARYGWDTGIAVGRFLAGLREGRVLARECRGCRRVLVPPRMFCEQCFRPTDRWVQVEDTGRVNTFSICWVSWDMQPLKVPELPAVIEIDGASPGIGIMHKLGEVDPDAVRIGLEVEAVWRPQSEREGSILDIEYFRPRDPKLQSTRGRPARKSTRPRKAASRIK
ncbi:MAG TPA: Zn-ribbon domain-containing OB-fold protein [Actinomycetota bacterium]|nr:Zn-ribbon domain-containing OB-fold protein [Actinomycetota bacterium]